MAIKPEDIDASKLPTAMRGYARDATEELLKRVAWDYRQLTRAQESWAKDEARLREQITELENQVTMQTEEFTKAIAARESRVELEEGSRDRTKTAQFESAGLQAENAQLQAELDRAKADLDRAKAEVDRLRNEQIDTDPDDREELVKTLLKTAQRAARELKDKAKKEADDILAEARRRAEEIESDAEEGARNSADEVERLQKLEEELRDRLRATLEAVLEGNNGSHPAVEAVPEAAHEPEPEHWPTASVD
jgi:cell division septum initiation protein DivIVA